MTLDPQEIDRRIERVMERFPIIMGRDATRGAVRFALEDLANPCPEPVEPDLAFLRELFARTNDKCAPSFAALFRSGGYDERIIKESIPHFRTLLAEHDEAKRKEWEAGR